MDSVNYITPTPPTYLKFGTLLEINEQQKEIHIAGSSDLPIAITGDRVASTVKAEQTLRILFGLNSTGLSMYCTYYKWCSKTFDNLKNHQCGGSN